MLGHVGRELPVGGGGDGIRVEAEGAGGGGGSSCKDIEEGGFSSATGTHNG